MDNHLSDYKGVCPICEANTTFFVRSTWYRDGLVCSSCVNGSVPRERALALTLNELVPHWRKLSIHESSPCDRGISAKLKKDAEHYVASQFFAGEPFGQMIRGFRNEDLQSMTFKDNCFDIFISLDVMEHVPSPDQAIREIWRHLKPGGLMLSTWPVRKSQTKDMEMRAVFNSDGTVTHLKNPEYHGNPVNAEGSLVTVDYGYDVHQMIAQCAPFDVRVYRFCDKTHGIIGEYTEVFACRKNLA